MLDIGQLQRDSKKTNEEILLGPRNDRWMTIDPFLGGGGVVQSEIV